MTKEQIQKEIDAILAERAQEEAGKCNCGPGYREKMDRLKYLQALLKQTN